MVRKTTLIAAAAALSAFAATTLPAAAQEVTLRLHQFLPLPAAIPAKAITPWIEKVEAESDGRIKVEHFPSMQLGGSPASLFDQAQDGVVDIVWTVLGYTPGRFSKAEVFELPFMGTTGEATSFAFHQYVMANAADEFATVKPIVLHTHGPGLLHVRGDGVQTLEDMQGLKLRGPSRVITALITKLQASGIGMPVPAVPEAISKGVLDGVVIPWEVTLPLKITELVETHTEFSGDHGLYTVGFVMAMNLDTYNGLPDDLKAVIDANSGPEVAALFGRAMDEVDVIGRAKAAESGNTIFVLDEAETARWREVGDLVAADWVAEMAEKGVDGEALIAEAQRLIEEASAE